MLLKPKSPRKDGVSLRTMHLLLIVGAVLIAGVMFFFTCRLSSDFRELTEASERQIELRKAARELMDASDYLTEKVQRFTVEGDMRFLNEYFVEAFEANHREEAISRMTAAQGSEEAIERLKASMAQSVALMDREYYAMRLVVEAKGYAEYPQQVREVTLSAADSALSAEEKMRRATEMVLDEEYYAQKEIIRENMRASLDELEKMAYSSDASALHTLTEEMLVLRIIISLQTIGVIVMVWLTARLGIYPVLNAVDRIKADSPIPEVGANEFRYLARAYNKMYEVYRSSLERLNFKASHDELTGAYNRAGYELLLSSLDLDCTYMLLFDVDNFKQINDTFGHETGDRVLKKLVRILRGNFRADDCVCRIGGDEFVVLMSHTSQLQQELVARKIEQINRELAKTEDGLPGASVSVGVVHGSQVASAEILFEQTDAAMYRSKQNGKNTYTFYSQE